MYFETSVNNFGHGVFVSLKRTDNVKMNNTSFYYNRISAEVIKSMRRFGIQLLSSDNSWWTRYNLLTNDGYSNSSKHWTLVNLNLTIENCGLKPICDGIETPLAVK